VIPNKPEPYINLVPCPPFCGDPETEPSTTIYPPNVPNLPPEVAVTVPAAGAEIWSVFTNPPVLAFTGLNYADTIPARLIFRRNDANPNRSVVAYSGDGNFGDLVHGVVGRTMTKVHVSIPVFWDPTIGPHGELEVCSFAHVKSWYEPQPLNKQISYIYQDNTCIPRPDATINWDLCDVAHITTMPLRNIMAASAIRARQDLITTYSGFVHVVETDAHCQAPVP